MSELSRLALISLQCAKAVAPIALLASCKPQTVSKPAANTTSLQASSHPGASTAVPPSPASYESLNRLHFVGRVATLPSGAVQYAWSGAGFRAHFSGTGLIVQMDDSAGYHSVVVDGTLRPALATQKGLRTYAVVENLSPGEHELALYRRTEAEVGVTTLHAVAPIDGKLLGAPPAMARHIEVIGDSISCGYGNEGPNTSCHFAAAQENHYLSYGALLARRFDADISTIAWSGRGIVRNYAGRAGNFMPELYQRVLPENPEVTQAVSAPAADFVLINLGTNDFSTEPDPSESVFVNAYVGLLEQARRRSPSAFILTTIGPMLGGPDLERAENCIRKAVAARAKAGDTRVTYYKMRTTNDAPACDWHPSLTTHAKIAKELEAPIASALKW